MPNSTTQTGDAPPQPSGTDRDDGRLDDADADRLAAAVGAGEDWLIARVLHYAARYGYTRHTSTLAEAWRGSIQGLSDRLLACLADRAVAPVDADHDHRRDDLAAFAVAEARKHRARGVSLGLFLGLMKHYRRAYLDLVAAAAGGAEGGRFVETFFDRVDVALAAEWSEQSEEGKLTELREGNRRIINEKNHYLTIFESLDQPVIVVDGNGRVAKLNHAASRLFTGAVTPGASDRRPRWLDDRLEAILADTGARGPFEVRLATADGDRDFDVRVERMLDVSRKFDGVVVMFADVTARKRAEAALAASARELEGVVAQRTADLLRLVDALTRSNQELESFAHAASHDLQEPLRQVASFAQLLASRYHGRLGADADDFIGYVVDGASRMSELIADLQAYHEAKTKAEPLAPVPAGEALADARDALAAVIREAGAEIVVGPLPVVTADRRQLAQLFQALLSNALKFRRSDAPPRVRVSAGGSGGMAEFSVADNGIGIADEHRDRVFLPFQRLHAHHVYPGSGIGLALARRIVERHHGTITAHPAEDGGTRIVFSLPLA